MKLRHAATGDVVEIPRPDELGASVVLFNGRVVETCLYSDVTNTVTTAGGRVFDSGEEWAGYISEQLRSGVWRSGKAGA